MKKLMVLFWYLVYAPEFWLIRRRIKKQITKGMEDVKAGRVSKIDMEEL